MNAEKFKARRIGGFERAGQQDMPDERTTRIPKEWQRMMDVTREFSALIGSLNSMEDTSDDGLH